MTRGRPEDLGVSFIWRAAPVLAALALAAGGCGGGSGSAAADRSGASDNSRSTTTTASAGRTSATPSDAQAKARLVAQADTICKRVNTEIEAVVPKNQSRKEVLRVVPRNVGIEQRGLRELEKLTPPASFAADWRKMLGYRRVLAEELAGFVADEKRGDEAAAKARFTVKERTHVTLETTGRSSGFKHCGSVG
jgi:hypothetical protein